MTQIVLTCDALVLSCIDFRLPHQITDYMDGRGFRRNYDHFILPGCSVARKRPHWLQTLEDVINIAVNVHQINRVIMIDHEDCAAYRQLCGTPTDYAHEIEQHKENAKIQKDWILEKFPHLTVECVMLDLEGHIKCLEHDCHLKKAC